MVFQKKEYQAIEVSLFFASSVAFFHHKTLIES